MPAFYQIAVGEDKRQFQRQRIFKAARIIAGKIGVFSCPVRNQSEKGALLEVSVIVGLPKNFEL
jgi:hypothetical protein